MKALDERTLVRATNANGGNGDHYQQHFEVAASDVGRTRSDHLGSPNHNPSVDTRYTFKAEDAGRTICVQTDNQNWHCFTFTTPPLPVQPVSKSVEPPAAKPAAVVHQYNLAPPEPGKNHVHGCVSIERATDHSIVLTFTDAAAADMYLTNHKPNVTVGE